MENSLNRVFLALKGLDVKCNVPLSTLTSFRIGGPAAMVMRPRNAEDIRKTIQACSQFVTPYCILGNGTNVLAPDAGYPGVIIRIDTPLTTPLFVDTTVTCPAGTALTVLARESVNMHLMGLESLSGIPGTVGGGVYMNAGAYGGEMRQVVTEVTALLPEGVRRFTAEEAAFGYRRSAFLDTEAVVLGARLRLTPDDPAAIRQRMDDLMARRRQSQPLEYPSAGSTFKRPVGAFAAALIDQCGLRGYRHGGAAVSEKHCGFVVNLGGATCADVLALCDEVRAVVKEKTGYDLEKEIRVVKA